MNTGFTAIIRPAPEGGYWAVCPEVPEANGQGETPEEARRSLMEAIELIFDFRRSESLSRLQEDARVETVSV